jgi:hypothetical protein
MNFDEAQRELRAAYIGGSPGVLVSGLSWLAAGLAWMGLGVGSAFAALCVGGMLIMPTTVLIERMLIGAPKTLSRNNPLGRLGLETTFVLFAGIFIGYGLLLAAPALALPAVATTIGARYFAFRTLYDEPLYWLLGTLIGAGGAVAMARLVPFPGNFALVIGVMEVGFSVLLFARWKRRMSQAPIKSAEDIVQ